VDEERKRRFLTYVLLLLMPILLCFAVLNLFTVGIKVDVILGLGGIITAAGMLRLMRLRGSLQPVYRIGVVYTLVMNSALLVTGGAAGVSYLWFYFYPLVTYFLLGHREGNFWVGCSWLIGLLVAVFNVNFYLYPFAIGIRFLFSYTLVCVLAYGLELSRYYYYRQLLSEKLALQAALQQVQTLQGLLPICASCKKIRDDSGYWHQVEIYMHHHAGIEFSHSICPDCRQTLYPTLSKLTNSQAVAIEQSSR